MKAASAFLFYSCVASVASLDSSVTIQRDGTQVTRDWSIACASVNEPTVATFSIELKTQSSYTTYSVDLASKFESTAVSSSEESFGELQVSTGGGESFTGLEVGVSHDLNIQFTYLSTGPRAVELTATVKTGDWSWPDREEFTETITLLIEEDGCTTPFQGAIGGGGDEPDDVTIDGAGRESSTRAMQLSLGAMFGCLTVLYVSL